MRDEYDKVQIKLKEKYFETLKRMGYANVGRKEINLDVLASIHDPLNVDPSAATKLAEKDIKHAEAEVFKDGHPLAPRKWRSWAAGKSKEF